MSAFASYYRENANGRFSDLSGYLSLGARETEGGERQNEEIYVEASLEVFGRLVLGLSWYDASYRPLLSDEPGEFSDTVNDDRYEGVSSDYTAIDSRYGFGLYATAGQMGGGDYEYLSAYLWTSPVEDVRVELSAERTESFGTSERVTVGGGWDITPRDGVNVQHIDEDGLESTHFLYRHTSRSGVDLFAVLDQDVDDGSQVTLKAVWTLR